MMPKTQNLGKSEGVKMQSRGRLLYIQVVVYEPHGNHKPKVYNRHTHTHTNNSIKRKQSKHDTKESHKTIRKESKKEEKNREELPKEKKKSN